MNKVFEMKKKRLSPAIAWLRKWRARNQRRAAGRVWRPNWGTCRRWITIRPRDKPTNSRWFRAAWGTCSCSICRRWCCRWAQCAGNLRSRGIHPIPTVGPVRSGYRYSDKLQSNQIKEEIIEIIEWIRIETVGGVAMHVLDGFYGKTVGNLALKSSSQTSFRYRMPLVRSSNNNNNNNH